MTLLPRSDKDYVLKLWHYLKRGGLYRNMSLIWKDCQKFYIDWFNILTDFSFSDEDFVGWRILSIDTFQKNLTDFCYQFRFGCFFFFVLLPTNFGLFFNFPSLLLSFNSSPLLFLHFPIHPYLPLFLPFIFFFNSFYHSLLVIWYTIGILRSNYSMNCIVVS